MPARRNPFVEWRTRQLTQLHQQRLEAPTLRYLVFSYVGLMKSVQEPEPFIRWVYISYGFVPTESLQSIELKHVEATFGMDLYMSRLGKSYLNASFSTVVIFRMNSPSLVDVSEVFQNSEMSRIGKRAHKQKKKHEKLKGTPPMPSPPRNKALLINHQPSMSLSNPLLKQHFRALLTLLPSPPEASREFQVWWWGRSEKQCPTKPRNEPTKSGKVFKNSGLRIVPYNPCVFLGSFPISCIFFAKNIRKLQDPTTLNPNLKALTTTLAWPRILTSPSLIFAIRFLIHNATLLDDKKIKYARQCSHLSSSTSSSRWCWHVFVFVLWCWFLKINIVFLAQDISEGLQFSPWPLQCQLVCWLQEHLSEVPLTSLFHSNKSKLEKEVQSALWNLKQQGMAWKNKDFVNIMLQWWALLFTYAFMLLICVLNIYSLHVPQKLRLVLFDFHWLLITFSRTCQYEIRNPGFLGKSLVVQYTLSLSLF